ncbi:hypothetical protein ABT373_38880 [Streptomyces sp. NPDC000070]|uniref:hypothetical protein n=1 Tax=Streptomyces sp. NPDC000070 TaxID=3154240 RepID=UPI00332E0577
MRAVLISRASSERVASETVSRAGAARSAGERTSMCAGRFRSRSSLANSRFSRRRLSSTTPLVSHQGGYELRIEANAADHHQPLRSPTT